METSRQLPTVPWATAIVVLAVFAAFGFARAAVDTDLYWHLETGRLVISGQWPSTDPFSFTYGGPWILHEWGGEVVLYGLVSVLGLQLTGAVFGVLAAVPLLLLARHPVALVIGAATVLPFVMPRPQVLSWTLLALTVVLLARVQTARGALLVVPLFTLWANLHGLWAVGLGVVAVYAVLVVVGAAPLRDRRIAALLVVGALAGVLMTPAGLELLAYPLRYVDASDWGKARISEWQSPAFGQLNTIGLLALIAALPRSGRAERWHQVIAIVGIVAALVAVRNAPVAAVLAMPALSAAFGEYRIQRAPAFRRLELAMAAVTATVIVAVAPTFAAAGDYFPNPALDRLLEVNPQARVLAEYSWGGYVIRRGHEAGLRVFVDGRNDMYGDAILDEYLVAVNAAPGWQHVLDQYRVTAILLPPDKALVAAAAGAGWRVVYRDEVAALLLPSR